ncbi:MULTISPECIES: glycerophosphodiester phosphodiesterase [unclassified Paenibacillus]|uniref:glycerophosphodiester phosphodiesterase n=1 Tax=unclassified Paenibacillus TaxID=185978 RepID=UPI002F42E7CF
MLRILGRSWRDFRASYKKLLAFEYFYMLLTSVLIIPSITLIFNRILMVAGSGSLLNSEVYSIGYNYEAVLGLILIGLVASFALFIELSVLVIMVQQRYFGRKITISDAFFTTLRQTPRLFGFGLVQLLVFLLILIPFIDSPLSKSFYALFNFPIFFQNKVLDASFTMTFIYVLLLLITLYMVLRWVFVLHFIMLEGMKITDAIRSSQALTRGRRLQLFVFLFVLNAIVFLIGFLVISSLSYLPLWLNINVLKVFSTHYSLTLQSILTYMFAALLMPLNIIFVTRLFYYFGYSEGLKPRNKLSIHASRLGKLERKLTIAFKKWKNKRLIIVSAAAIYLGLALFVGFKANDGLVYAKWTVLISAHRGDTENAPENSIPAITHAIEKGIQSVEIDVQLTKDGVAVLHHDVNLKRMAGIPQRVPDLTYDQVSKLTIGRDTENQPIRIPMLSEALAEAQGRSKLLVDLKPYGPSDDLVKEVVKLIKAFEMEQEVYIQSFDKTALLQIRELEPEIKIGQILYFALGNLSSLDVDFYTIEQTMLTDQLVDRAHAVGREIWVWTVNSRNNMKEVLKYKVDGIITDYPARAQSLLDINL